MQTYLNYYQKKYFAKCYYLELISFYNSFYHSMTLYHQINELLASNVFQLITMKSNKCDHVHGTSVIFMFINFSLFSTNDDVFAYDMTGENYL